MTVSGHSEVVTYWTRIVGTLAQRGLLTQRKDGQKVIPQAVALVEPERVSFVLNMLRLGGVSREKWLDPNLAKQIKATLQGRRCFVADSGGLAIVIAREPGEPQRKRLPRRVILTPEAIPEDDYAVLLGESRSGPVTLDIEDHERAILVGGTSGSGKTSAIRSMLVQLVRKHPPEELQISLVDLKEIDFMPLAGLPHLDRPIATNEEEATDLLAQAYMKMLKRREVMREKGVYKWDLMPREERFPLLLLVIDEYADLAGTNAEDYVIKIARKGLASRVSLVLATQRPDADVFSPKVKANVPTRIAFRTTSASNSRIILERTGAEKLARPGQCITNAGGRWRTVQTAFISAEDLDAWIDRAPDESVLSEIETALVQYAIRKLEGAFKIDALYEAQEQGELQTNERISRHALDKLAQKWQAWEWLTEPQRNDKGHKIGRQVTVELAHKAQARAATLRHNMTHSTSESSTLRHNTHHTTIRPNPVGAEGDEIPEFLKDRAKSVA